MEIDQKTLGYIDTKVEVSSVEDTTETNKLDTKLTSNKETDPMSDQCKPDHQHSRAVDKLESAPPSKDETNEYREITTANTNVNPVTANTSTEKSELEADTIVDEKTVKTTELDSVSVSHDESDSMNVQVSTEKESYLKDKDESNGCMEITAEDNNSNHTSATDDKIHDNKVAAETNITLMEYRSTDTAAPAEDSSDTEDSSSDSSDDEEDDKEKDVAEHESTENKINKALSERDESPDRDRKVKLNRYGLEDVRTKGELLPEDLPPLEELTITVDESVEMRKVGTIKSVIGILVIIQTCENVPPLNEDTILFVEGHKVLGQVFEVFGPVQTPWYSIRFNEEENIKSKGLEAGMPVYCAPKEETFTKYVFVDTLKNIKGSDASWEDNNEPPAKHVEYSDDESERRAKSKRKKKKPSNNRETEEENQPNDDSQSKRSRKPNNQAQHHGGPGQHQQFRPRNPFQGGGNNMNRARYPGGNFNQRQNYNPRGPPWAGQGNENNSVSPRFGGPPRFQPQVNGHGGRMQYAPANVQHGSYNVHRQGFPQGNNTPQQGYPQGNNTPQQGYPQGNNTPQQGYSQGNNTPQQGYPQGNNTPQQGYPQGNNTPQQGYPQGNNTPQQSYSQGNNPPPQGFSPGRFNGGNMPRPGLSGDDRPGIGPQGPANSCTPRFQGPPSTAPNFQSNLSQPNMQGNGPFRSNVQPPSFNAVGLNNQSSNCGQSFNNSSQGQPTFCQPSQQTQNTPANNFVTNSNPQFNQSNNMNNQFQNPSSFQPNLQNQFGNNSNQQFTMNAPANQFRPNSNPQMTTMPPNSSNQNTQLVQNSQTQFQNMNAPNQNRFQGNNQPQTTYNQSRPPLVPNNGNAPRNQLRIHGLNPGLQSNNGNAPVAPVNNGFETVQLNSANIKPYRPELGQSNNEPTNFGGVPPPSSVNTTVNTGTYQGGNGNMFNPRPGSMGQGQQSHFGYQAGPQGNNMQRPGAPGMDQQNFSNFQHGVLDQRFIQNN